MNTDAEKWIDHYGSVLAPGEPFDPEAMADAMRWAYADAARICQREADGYWYGDGAASASSCASSIEDRAK